jgi:hypothetical protein
LFDIGGKELNLILENNFRKGGNLDLEYNESLNLDLLTF